MGFAVCDESLGPTLAGYFSKTKTAKLKKCKGKQGEGRKRALLGSMLTESLLNLFSASFVSRMFCVASWHAHMRELGFCTLLQSRVQPLG